MTTTTTKTTTTTIGGTGATATASGTDPRTRGSKAGGMFGASIEDVADDDPMATAGFTPIISFIIDLCSFPDDSTMVAFIKQQGWTALYDVTTISINGVKDFKTVRNDGFTYKASVLSIHLRALKGFIMYYNRRSRDFFEPLDTDDTMMLITKVNFVSYLCSEMYHADLAAASTLTDVPSPTVIVVSDDSKAIPADPTVEEIQCGSNGIQWIMKT